MQTLREGGDRRRCGGNEREMGRDVREEYNPDERVVQKGHSRARNLNFIRASPNAPTNACTPTVPRERALKTSQSGMQVPACDEALDRRLSDLCVSAFPGSPDKFQHSFLDLSSPQQTYSGLA